MVRFSWLRDLFRGLLLRRTVSIFSQILFTDSQAKVWGLTAFILVEKLRILNSGICRLVRIAWRRLNAKLFEFHLISTLLILKSKLSSFGILLSWLLSFWASSIAVTRCCVPLGNLSLTWDRSRSRSIPLELQLSSGSSLLPILSLILLIESSGIIFIIIDTLRWPIRVLAHYVLETLPDIKPNSFWSRRLVGRYPVVYRSLIRHSILNWRCADIVQGWICTFQRVPCDSVLLTFVVFEVLVKAIVISLHHSRSLSLWNSCCTWICWGLVVKKTDSCWLYNDQVVLQKLMQVLRNTWELWSTLIWPDWLLVRKLIHCLSQIGGKSGLRVSRHYFEF